MSVRFTVSPCVLLDPGGAGGAIVTRRLIFPSLVTAALPKDTDARRSRRPCRIGGSSPSTLSFGSCTVDRR